MEKIYYNNQGWVCKRYPYDITIDDENRYIEVDEETYSKTLCCAAGKAWRVVNGTLQEQVYNESEYDKQQALTEITTLKEEIIKCKEDVEQVELFGMERSDYEQKKARCVEIVLRLRELEAIL